MEHKYKDKKKGTYYRGYDPFEGKFYTKVSRKRARQIEQEKKEKEKRRIEREYKKRQVEREARAIQRAQREYYRQQAKKIPQPTFRQRIQEFIRDMKRLKDSWQRLPLWLKIVISVVVIIAFVGFVWISVMVFRRAEELGRIYERGL